jgi:hypothetical protein
VVFNPAYPNRFTPTPTIGTDLHVHPQRDRAVSRPERELVAIFLRRYIVWCGRTRRVDRLRGAADLLAEVA